MPRTPLRARRAGSRRPMDADPWMPAIAGTFFYLLISEQEAVALAAGLIRRRVRRQAHKLLERLDHGQEAAR